MTDCLVHLTDRTLAEIEIASLKSVQYGLNRLDSKLADQ